MAKVIIFGINDFAELAHYYIETDSEHNVACFVIDDEYLPAQMEFKGLPIIPSSTLTDQYPPSEYKMFTPMAPKKMNKLREEIYCRYKEIGYDFISYVSSKATIFNGEIGENCFILENNTIQPFTKIGDNVVLWSGNHIGHHSIIESHVSITSHVVISGHCNIRKNCFIGVNATIRDGVNLADGTLVGMSASISKDTESWSVYLGNPAIKKGNKPSYEVY